MASQDPEPAVVRQGFDAKGRVVAEWREWREDGSAQAPPRSVSDPAVAKSITQAANRIAKAYEAAVCRKEAWAWLQELNHEGQVDAVLGMFVSLGIDMPTAATSFPETVDSERSDRDHTCVKIMQLAQDYASAYSLVTGANLLPREGTDALRVDAEKERIALREAVWEALK